MYHLLRSLYLHYTSKEEYSILLLGLDNAGKTTLLNQIKALYNVHHAPSAVAAPPSSTAGDTVPTVGQNVATIDLPDMYLKIWDVGGQMSLRRLWTSYYSSCHAVVFVLDSTDLGILDVDTPLPTPGTPLTPGLGGTKWHVRRGSSYNMSATTTTSNDDRDDDSDLENETKPHPAQPGSITPTMLPGPQHTQSRLLEARLTLESLLSNPSTAGLPILVLANKQDRDDCLELVRIKEGFVRPVFEGERGEMVRDSRVLGVSALRGTGVKEAVEWIRSRVLWNKGGRPPVMR